MVPRPPLVIQRFGCSNLKYWAAHIWCWPTSVVMKMSRFTARVMSYSRWMAYCGLMIAPGSRGWVKRRQSMPRQVSICRHQTAIAGRSTGAGVGIPGRQQGGQRAAGIADDRQFHRHVLVDAGGVDVDVDFAAAGAERVQPAGDAVVEAGADVQHARRSRAWRGWPRRCRACRACRGTAGRWPGRRRAPSACWCRESRSCARSAPAPRRRRRRR